MSTPHDTQRAFHKQPHVAYQLVLATGICIPVAEPVTPVHRVLLLQHLPQALANDLRLRRVSRERHIEIFLDGTAWFLIAYATTFLDGQRLPLQQSIALPTTGCALLLGSEGWPIEVVLT